MIERLEEYHHKLLLMRQIMSNKANRFRRINTTANILLVVVSSLLTFIGFSGTAKILESVNWVVPSAQLTHVEFAFNVLVLFLFILTTLHLVFRFGEQQAKSE